MPTLDAGSRKTLRGTARAYHRQLLSEAGAAARDYYGQRGFTAETITRFGLGFVAEPAPGDQQYTGRLSIPYVTRCPVRGRSVTTIRFRALGDEKPKYLSYPGESERVYHPEALLENTDVMCVCEGELDTVAATQAGLPAVGTPGANAWPRWGRRLFNGYSTVFVLADNDDAGRRFGDVVASDVARARVVPMPDGDVNSTMLARGEAFLREMVGM